MRTAHPTFGAAGLPISQRPHSSRTTRAQSITTSFGIETEESFAKYSKGEMGDDVRVVDWANDYCHHVALRSDLGKKLHEAA